AEAERKGPAAALPPINHVFRDPALYLLVIGSMLSIGAVGGVYQNLKLFLIKVQGYSQGAAFQVASWILLFSVAGRLLMGWLADRIPRKHVMLLIYLLIVAAIPLL